jgi:hypothetical protein
MGEILIWSNRTGTWTGSWVFKFSLTLRLYLRSNTLGQSMTWFIDYRCEYEENGDKELTLVLFESLIEGLHILFYNIFGLTIYWSTAKPWTSLKQRSNDLVRSKFHQQVQSFVCVPSWRRVTFKFWEMLKNASEVTLVPKDIHFLKILNFVQSFVECKVSLSDGKFLPCLLKIVLSYFSPIVHVSMPQSREWLKDVSKSMLMSSTNDLGCSGDIQVRRRMGPEGRRAHSPRNFRVQVGWGDHHRAGGGQTPEGIRRERRFVLPSQKGMYWIFFPTKTYIPPPPSFAVRA